MNSLNANKQAQQLPKSNVYLIAKKSNISSFLFPPHFISEKKTRKQECFRLLGKINTKTHAMSECTEEQNELTKVFSEQKKNVECNFF